MALTKWTYCPSKECMSQQYHTLSSDGVWYCDNCGKPNPFVNVSIAVQNIAERELEKENVRVNQKSTKSR